MSASKFARSLAIITPIVLSLMDEEDGDTSFVETALIDRLEQLESWWAKVCDELQVSQQGEVAAALLPELSEMLCHRNIESTAGCVSAIAQSVTGLTDKLPEPVENVNEISRLVKAAMFTGAVRLSRMFNQFCDDGYYIHEQIRVICNASIANAATLAFHWSKKSGCDQDREGLFVEVLPNTLNVCEQIWLKLASEKISSNNVFSSNENAGQLTVLKQVLANNDMGWADTPSGVSMVYRRICDDIDAVLYESLPQGLPQRMNTALREKMLALYEHAAIDAWSEAATRLEREISDMSPEQINEFAQGEGSEPMKYDRFSSIFEQKSAMITPDFTPEISQEELTVQARKKLVFLWGVSDAASQTQTVPS